MLIQTYLILCAFSLLFTGCTVDFVPGVLKLLEWKRGRFRFGVICVPRLQSNCRKRRALQGSASRGRVSIRAGYVSRQLWERKRWGRWGKVGEGVLTSEKGVSQWNSFAISPQNPLGSAIERAYISSYSFLSFRLCSCFARNASGTGTPTSCARTRERGARGDGGTRETRRGGSTRAAATVSACVEAGAGAERRAGCAASWKPCALERRAPARSSTLPRRLPNMLPMIL